MDKDKNVRQDVAGKNIGIIAYITIIGLIIAFILNNDKNEEFASYHIRQSLGLAVSMLVLWVIGFLPLLGWFLAFVGYIALFVMWIMGLMKAINGKRQPVPILGEKYAEWFSGL